MPRGGAVGQAGRQRVDEATREQRREHVGERGEQGEARDRRGARRLLAPIAEGKAEDGLECLAPRWEVFLVIYRCPAHRATDFPVRRASKTQQPGRANIAGGKRNGLSGNGAADGLAENSGAGADGGLDQLRRGTTFGKVAGIRNICTSPEVNG